MNFTYFLILFSVWHQQNGKLQIWLDSVALNKSIPDTAYTPEPDTPKALPLPVD